MAKFLNSFKKAVSKVSETINDVTDEVYEISGNINQYRKLNYPEEYVVIDIETTGLNPNLNEIIELSALHVLNGIITDKFTSLVNPGIIISPDITELTGITNRMVRRSPKLNEIFCDYRDFIGSYPILGHNVTFDIRFINHACLTCHERIVDNLYFDTLKISRILYPTLKYHRLCDLPEVLHVPYENKKAHRSLYDCKTTQACYMAMLKIINKNKWDYKNYVQLHKPNLNYNFFEKEIFDPRTLVPETTSFDTSHPLYKKDCIFTGFLSKMSRLEAQQIVVNLGGSCGINVTKKTRFLIVGNNVSCNQKDNETTKLKKAKDYKAKGQDIQIISENEFYELID